MGRQFWWAWLAGEGAVLNRIIQEYTPGEVSVQFYAKFFISLQTLSRVKSHLKWIFYHTSVKKKYNFQHFPTVVVGLSNIYIIHIQSAHFIS